MAHRLFVGISLPDSLRAVLYDATKSIALDTPCALHTAEQYHVTLAFLGMVEQETQEAVMEALSQVRFSAFSLTVGAYNIFPKGILYRQVLPTGSLLRLHTNVCDALRSIPVPFVEQLYVPHVTLARKAHCVSFPPCVPPLTFSVEHFSLFLSSRINGILTYTPIAQWEASA